MTPKQHRGLPGIGMLLLLLFLIGLVAQSIASDVLPSDRRADWTLAGVPGGIPHRTTIFQTLSSTATSDQIQTAINSCPSNQVVQLGAGNFTIGGDIRITTDYVTLRGSTNAQGWPTTRLIMTSGGSGYSQAGIDVYGGIYPANDYPGLGQERNISGGLTHGSTNVTVTAAPSGLSVGDIFIIDQNNGAIVNDSGGFIARPGNHSVAFMARCTAVNGNTVTFWPPLVGTYWNTSDGPQIYYWGNQAARWVGVEDLFIDPTSSGVNGARNLFFSPAYACWARNVKTTRWWTGGGASAVGWFWAVQCEMRDCYFYDATAVSSSSYATYAADVSYCKFESNISSNVALVFPNIAAQACVWSANVAVGPMPYSPNSFLPEMFFNHGGFPSFCLYENNWIAGNIFLGDGVFNSNCGWITVSRNRIEGWFPGKTGNTTPMSVANNSGNQTIIGNVLGMEGQQSSYSSSTPGSAGNIYAIQSTAIGTIRTNNYNTVDDAVRNIEAIGANTQEISYVYPSKPGFFRDRQWPPYPVTSVATNALYFTNSPAGYRLYFGEWPVGSGAPIPPTGLKVLFNPSL